MNTPSKCRSCGAAIIWCVTTTGKRIPIDEAPFPGGNMILDGECDAIVAVVVPVGEGTHRSHFVTCPHAAQHRRSKGQGTLPGLG